MIYLDIAAIILCLVATGRELSQGKDFEDWVWPITTAIWILVNMKCL